MRINFDASFQQVQRLMTPTPGQGERLDGGARARFSGSVRSFEKLLQSPDNINENASPAEVSETPIVPKPAIPENEIAPIKMNFSMSSPMPKIGIPEKVPIPIPPQINDEVPVAPVKTPTVLRARRIPASDTPLHLLPRPERMSKVQELVEVAGQKFGVDPTLGMSVVSAESNFNPRAISQDGHFSKGLFQLLDRTGQEWKGKLGITSSYDPFHPEQNVELGVGYLRHLHELFSQESDLGNGLQTRKAGSMFDLERFSVAAFNAGQGRVASAQKRAERAGFDPTTYNAVEAFLPETTRSYVEKVMKQRSELAQNNQG